jgi:hypothetical protein
LGTQLPVHAPFEQTNGQSPDFSQEPAVHVCTLEPEHRVAFGEHSATLPLEVPFVEPPLAVPPLSLPALLPEPVALRPLESPDEPPDEPATPLPMVAVPQPAIKGRSAGQSNVVAFMGLPSPSGNGDARGVGTDDSGCGR